MSTVERTPTGAPPRRVLVTGSRTWANPAVIRDALQQVWGDGDTVLVTRAAPHGANRIAEMFWRRWGGKVERHPADWQLHQGAADVCLAFVRDKSPGASRTVHLAESAGIPVYLHTNTSRSLGTGQATDDNSREAETKPADSAPGGTPASDDLVPAEPPTERARTAPPAAGREPAGWVWLDVPYRQKNEAKKLGARWDRQARRWYAPAGMTEGLSRWTPVQPPTQFPAETPSESTTTASEPTNRGGGTTESVTTPGGEQTRPGPDDLVSPAEVATLYSYPEIAGRIAAFPPDSDGGRQARAAMALLLDDPGMYAGGDQAEAIARQFSAEEIARHREIVGHGPLFETLGRAAELQHTTDAVLTDAAGNADALEQRASEAIAREDAFTAGKALHQARHLPRQAEAADQAIQRHPAVTDPAPTPQHSDAAASAPAAADAPAGGELLSPAEVATHYSYPEISAMLAGCADSDEARVCQEALTLLLDQPGLYAGGDQAEAIARQFSAEEIARHREIVGHGPLFETLGRAAELHNHHRTADLVADNDPGGREAEQPAGDAAASVSRARQAVEDAQSVLNAQRSGEANEQRRRQIARWNHADETGADATAEHDQRHLHDDGGVR